MENIARISLDLTEEQVAEFKVAFNILDKDGDGEIDIHDLKNVMGSFGLNSKDSELQSVLDGIDIDGNGTIDFSEFLATMSKKAKDPDLKTELREVFYFFDRDANGFITPANLYHYMTSIGEQFSEEEVDEMIREADTVGDGVLSYSEFLEMMTK